MVSYAVQRVDVDQTQLASWSGRVAAGQMQLNGPCPVCGHDSPIVINQQVTPMRPASGPKAEAIALTCSCDQPHQGQPDATSGCGRHWSCTATTDANNRVTLSVLDNPALSTAADALRAAGETQLADLRTAAQRWIGGVTALFSLFGLAGVTLTRSTVADLQTGWQVVMAVAVAVAVALAGVAIFSIYRAAYGWPVTRPITGNEALLEWYAAREAAPRVQAEYLKDGVRAAGAALAVLVLTSGILWFAPQRQPALPMVQVTLSDGTQVCGTLLPAIPGATLVRRASDGTSVDISPRSIEALTVVTKC